MTALEAIQLVVEKKAPKGWATAVGVYANLTRWPHEIQYYVKCPKCGKVHGDFKNMREAHAKRLCGGCDLEAIDKLKDQIVQVIDDPEKKVKPMAKIMGEAVELFNPFDEPPERPEGVPIPPEDEPSLGEPHDTMGEIDRLLMGNWVDVALRQFADNESHDLTDLEIDERWSERHGHFDPSNREQTTIFKVDIGNEEWLFFKDSDEAEKYALEGVKDDLRNEPGIFTQSWLQQFVDKEKLADAIGDPNEDWEEENVGNLDYEELLAKMVEESYIDFDDPIFFKKNGDARVENTARYKRLQAIKDDYVEKEKPAPPDPWQWLEDVYGKEEAGKQAIQLAGIDIDAAAKSAVSTDGWEHFVARHDGNSSSLENGAIYCRIN
jgi:hypothetical protein